MRQRLLPKQLPAFLARLRATKRFAIPLNPVSIRGMEEQRAPADSSTQAASSNLVKKYELGSGEHKVNVRIYKEPPAGNL
jgi:hypothetical protein